MIKLQVKEPYPEKLKAFAGQKIFLVAATLRPETMYGQTNCFVLPEGEYGVFEMKDGELFIASKRSVRNMAYQGLTKEEEKFEPVATILGTELIGLPLNAPLSPYDTVYALPMMTISMNKVTHFL